MNSGPYTVDDPEGRAELLAQNALIFGMDKCLIAPELSIEQGFIAWELVTPNGLNSEIVNLARVKEIYANKYA